MEEKQIQIPDVNADAEERDNYTLIQDHSHIRLQSRL